MSWTDERVETLRALWQDGLTASAIAAEIGHGITRNAVISKIHRLGASGRAKPQVAPRRTPHRKPPAPKLIDPDRALPGRIGFNTGLPQWTLKGKKTPRTPLPEEPPAFDPATPCTLMELRAHMCRWPLGDPRDESFRFCGAHTDTGPYCPGHAAMAYARPDVRRDRALARLVVNNLPTAQAIRRGAVA